jgi:hypothetical protein
MRHSCEEAHNKKPPRFLASKAESVSLAGHVRRDRSQEIFADARYPGSPPSGRQTPEAEEVPYDPVFGLIT